MAAASCVQVKPRISLLIIHIPKIPWDASDKAEKVRQMLPRLQGSMELLPGEAGERGQLLAVHVYGGRANRCRLQKSGTLSPFVMVTNLSLDLSPVFTHSSVARAPGISEVLHEDTFFNTIFSSFQKFT